MAKEKLKHSIEKVSKVVRYCRRCKKTSPLAFAKELDKAPMLIDLIEHADSDEGARLCALLPAHEINDLSVCLEEVYGRPFSDLYAEAAQADEPSGGTDEVTLYLPMTVSVERAIDLIDQIILLTVNEKNLEREQVIRSGVLSAGMLVQLLYGHHLQHGLTAEASACLTRFTELVEARK